MTPRVKVSSQGGMDRYSFNFFKRSPAAHEPLAHPQSEPFVVFSTAPGWGQAMAMENTAPALPAAVAGKIGKLKAQYPDRADLLAALQKAVAVEVQNCRLGVETTGWQPRPLERVALSNYGTRLEKALLLQAMLKQAGFASELLAVAGDAFDAKVATPLQIREYWLKATDGPGQLVPGSLPGAAGVLSLPLPRPGRLQPGLPEAWKPARKRLGAERRRYLRDGAAGPVAAPPARSW